ncbi:hypothetical protein FRC03_005774 [Tulasnella sp. 419]|nr:hypothetical protein FRC03_005774 [Tulasnella sp. 419]
MGDVDSNTETPNEAKNESNDETKRKTIAYVVSGDLVKVSSLLPSNKGRSLLVHSLVKSFGFFKPSEKDPPIKNTLIFLKPVPATQKDLLVYHDQDYLDKVLSPVSQEDASVSQKGSTDSDNAEFGLEDVSKDSEWVLMTNWGNP